MVRVELKSLLEKEKMSRYRLQQITNWNYRRINALYSSNIKYITLEEIEVLTSIFKCTISDLIKQD